MEEALKAFSSIERHAQPTNREIGTVIRSRESTTSGPRGARETKKVLRPQFLVKKISAQAHVTLNYCK